MAVEFTKEKRFIGFWFVYPPAKDSGFPHRRADWFAASWLNPDGTLEFAYRFHYYYDPMDPAEGERSWQQMMSREPADTAEIEKHKAFMKEVAGLNVVRNQASMDFIDAGLCNGEEALLLLADRPWWHEAKGRIYNRED